MTDQEIIAAKEKIPPTARERQIRSIEQFLLHGLHCQEPNCLLPLCVNTKLMFKHTQRCSKTDCLFCQQITCLIPKHTESCVDNFCCVPFCMETKLKTFLESQVDQSKVTDAATTKSQESHALAKDYEISKGKEISSISTGMPFSASPSKTTQRKKIVIDCSVPVSRESELASNHTSSAQESSAPFKKLSADSYLPRALKRRRTCWPSRAKVTSLIKLPRPTLKEHGRQKLTKATAILAHAEKEPISASHGSSLTTATREKTTSLLAGRETVQENAVESTQSLKEIPSLYPALHVESAVKHQVEENKELRESAYATCVTSPGEDSQEASPVVRLRLNSSMGRDNEHSCTNSILLKTRFIHALRGIMRLTMKAKGRGELLTCLNSLRSALQEIKNLDQA